MRTIVRVAIASSAVAMLGAAIGAQSPPRCRIEGRITSRGIPLPGVSIVVHIGDAQTAATSTGVDGRYSLTIAAGASSRLSATFTAFVSAERELTLDGPACDQTADLELALEPRTVARAPAVPATQTAPR